MSPRARNVTARTFVRALEEDGYILRKKSKSGHRVYKHPHTGMRVDVPYHHSGESFRPGTLSALIKAAGWDDDDLLRLRLVRKGRGK